jgi:hypothetical protein
VSALISLLGHTGALVLLSAIAGVLLVLAFSRLSFQSRIKVIKQRIGASLLESVTFRRDIVVALQAHGKTLVRGLAYLAITTPSFLVLAVPCVLLLAQLYPYFGVQPVLPSESLIVGAKLNKPSELFSVRLSSNDAETRILPPVRDKEAGEIWWRVDPKRAGVSELLITTPSSTVTLRAHAGESSEALDTTAERSWLSRVLFPSSIVLTPGFEQVSVSYPDRDYRLFGMSWSWLVLFFVVSLVSGFAAAKMLRIQV